LPIIIRVSGVRVPPPASQHRAECGPFGPPLSPKLARGGKESGKGSAPKKPAGPASIFGCVKPARTDFKGYEGRYVATDTRTGQVVIADENLKIVLEKVRELDHVVVGGRVPYADEPIYLGLG
jgi:hypothetical protein